MASDVKASLGKITRSLLHKLHGWLGLFLFSSRSSRRLFSEKAWRAPHGEDHYKVLCYNRQLQASAVKSGWLCSSTQLCMEGLNFIMCLISSIIWCSYGAFTQLNLEVCIIRCGLFVHFLEDKWNEQNDLEIHHPLSDCLEQLNGTQIIGNSKKARETENSSK